MGYCPLRPEHLMLLHQMLRFLASRGRECVPRSRLMTMSWRPPRATPWFAANLEHGWASCPITENGTARVMASAGYPNPLPVAAILERLAMAKAAEHHRFWPDDVSLTDAEVFKLDELLGPKQIA